MTTLPQGLTVEQWVDRINGKWQKLVDNSASGFLDIGHDLNQAKFRHGKHGGWMNMVKQLKFSQSVANKLMRIAKWREQVPNYTHDTNLEQLLPPDYNTIAQLAQLAEPVFLELVRNGTVNPSLGRNEVSKILRLEKIKGDEKRVLNLRPRPGKYRTLVVDPAWDYDWLSTGTRARIGYACQTLEQLRELDLKQWAEPECHLYCWSTNNFIREACNLVEHWGFQNKTLLAWIKPPPFGMGNYFRNSTEVCIFATLGETKTRPAAASMPTHFFADRGEHSEKPEEFYEIVRAASYPPYGEANQRKMRPDFTDLFMSGEPLKAVG